MATSDSGEARLSPQVANARLSFADEAENNRRFESYSLHNARNELWEGDTLVIIDLPPHKGSAPTDCFGTPWEPIKVRVSSEKIKALGSPKFDGLLQYFGSRSMKKAQKRGLKEDDLKGVKYMVDLTPSEEGDDMVFQMTQLSLTPGIMNWWTAVEKHGVSKDIAGGHDDVCNCWKDPFKSFHDTTVPVLEYAISRFAIEGSPDGNAAVYTLGHHGRAVRLLTMKEKGKTETDLYPEFRTIPDYCPIRHRMALLRLLFLMEGKHIVIDSAPRLWTLVALAKIFDCVHLVVPWARAWLTAKANSHFIEVLPEEAFQLAMTVRFIDIAKSTFSILVNEKALELAAEKDGIRKPASRLTVFGRKKRDLSDDLENVVEHAAQAFTDRTKGLLDAFLSDTIFDQLLNQEWAWLKKVEAMLDYFKDKIFDELTPGTLQELRALKKKVLDTWRTELVEGSLMELPNEDDMSLDNDRALYVEPAEFNLIRSIYQGLGKYQKVLLPLFYLTFTKRWQEGPFVRYRVVRCLEVHDAVSAFNEKLARWILYNRYQLRGTPWESLPDEKRVFSVENFDAQITVSLTPLVLSQWTHTDIAPPLTISRHLLLNLSENELKYLPLWAGGNDDGTGGVFEERVPPPATMGPVGPGPSYHTGCSDASESSSYAGSISSDLRALEIKSTVCGGSLDVQDSSASTNLNHGSVVAGSASIRSEAFTDESEDSNTYNDARFEVPADDQTISSALVDMVTAGSEDESGASGGEQHWNDSDYEFEDDSDCTLSASGDNDDNSGEPVQDGNVADSAPRTSVSSTSAGSTTKINDEDDDDDMVFVL